MLLAMLPPLEQQAANGLLPEQARGAISKGGEAVLGTIGSIPVGESPSWFNSQGAIGSAIEQFETENPRLARNLEALGMIATACCLADL